MPDYATDGDQGFGGVNMRLDPGQIPPGLAASARNKRFLNAVARTRPGVVLLPWSNKAEDDYIHQVYAENSIVRYSGKRATVDSTATQPITAGYVASGVTAGDFSSASAWDDSGSRWSVANNAATVTATGDVENLAQTIGTTVDRDYLVKFEITAWTSGTVTPYIGNESSDPSIPSHRLDKIGEFTRIIHAKGGDPNKIKLQASANFIGTIDNVSVSEPAQVQIRDYHCSNHAYTTQAACESASHTWVKPSGPLSNPDKGPYFKRDSNAAGTVVAPLDGSGNLNTGWVDLGSRVFKFGTVYGVGLYSDPNSVEYLLVATPTGVYATKEGMLAFKLAGLVDAGGTVTFVQAFNRVVMFRGESKHPYIMNNLTNGFVAVLPEENTDLFDENDQGDGTEVIPNASTGIYFQNRLIIPHTRDLVSASDFLNVTLYQPVLSSFRINQGSADSLVALHKFDNTTIVCFKESSVYMVKNVYGNLTDLVLDEMSSGYGCAAAKSIVSVGRDVWFLSEKRGVCSLGITESGAVQGVDQPISEPIQPLIDRINWHHADKAVSAYANNRFYIAVPLDGNSSNSAVFIFDFLNQLWTGYDDGVSVQEWVQPTVWGRKRLCFVSTDGTVNLYDDYDLGGIKDETTDAAGEVANVVISDELTTRGYNLGTPDRKKWHAARVNVQTLASSFTASALVDGVEEKTVISTVTPDRTKYDKPFYQADFVTTNANDDFNVPYRQDYSVELGSSDTILIGTGINPDFHQESTHKLRLREEGRYTQVKIESSQGSTRLTSVLVDGLPRQNILRKET